MKTRWMIPLTFLLTVLVWMALSWPLPGHMTTAITVSSHGGQDQPIRYMIPSDSLQLLYYFQLVREWITGVTPFFFNLYEFNTGIDVERFAPGGYYVPFSLVYALGASLAGQAFGLNLAALFSLWGTMLATWLLVRRYVRDEWIVALFSVFVVVFPYRWITLFDSSPTGYGMMWVPVLFLALDMAARDGKIRGGLLAGITLPLIYLGDVHVFFFSVLATPAWCLLALTMDSSVSGSWPRRFTQRFKALLPVAVGAVLVVFMVRFQAAQLEETRMAGGRNLGEVALFSPTKDGFLKWKPNSVDEQVYLGWPLVGLLLVGGLAMTALAARQPRTELRALLFWVLLIAGSTLAAILALGPHGLRHGGLFGLVRELIPPYAMIRQAGKIFCLMPTLLAVAGALSLNALIRVTPFGSWWRTACLGVFGSMLVVGYTVLSSPALTRLKEVQGAYQAVAEDARAQRVVPRALVVVLWPGDSHFASVYQHFALAHHVRIVNGYSPAYTSSYFQNVFLPFYNVNQGYLGDDQVDRLLSRGIGYLILHEDMYPEKVAPFPVTFAIRHFLEHPRLRFLRQDGSVWAFKLLRTSKSSVEASLADFPFVESWETFFPARHWEMERSRASGVERVEHPSASGRAYLTLAQNKASVTLASTGAPSAPNLRWLLRAKGQGVLRAKIFVNGEALFTQELEVRSDEWTWLPVFAPILSFAEIGLRLEHVAGKASLDSALLTAGTWPTLKPGDSLGIPAPSFFHAGHTDTETGRLVFRRDHDPRRIVFYGPKMPFAPGTYEVALSFSSSADEGTHLGMLHMEADWNTRQGPGFPVHAGQSPRFEMNIEENLPANIVFVFFGTADMTLDRVVFTRTR